MLGLCASCTLLSCGVIKINNFMMSPERFSNAMALTCLHMFVNFVFCTVLYWLQPDLFPTMQASECIWSEVFRWFLPPGLLFAMGLFFRNRAYVSCSPPDPPAHGRGAASSWSSSSHAWWASRLPQNLVS